MFLVQVVVVFSEDHRCSPRKSIARPVLFVHAKLLIPNSISEISEMLDPRILWSSAERGESITDRLLSIFFCYVSSFFETIFLLIDNQLKPYLFRYRALVGVN
jgi:hypothetical protein